MKPKLLAICVAFFSMYYTQLHAQGSISGNLETTYQYLVSDSAIGALQPDEESLVNSYMNINYRNQGFKAGVRFEAYLPRILGYPDRFDGAGLGYRYFGYENDLVDITVGNFYEQFGSGLIFRAYEDRALGFDNMMNGFKVNLRPYKGVTLKTVYGRQRFSFVGGKNQYSPAIVRGADLEFNLNQWFPKLSEKKFRITAAGTSGQVLKKNTGTDYDYSWMADDGGVGGDGNNYTTAGSVTGENLIVSRNGLSDVTMDLSTFALDSDLGSYASLSADNTERIYHLTSLLHTSRSSAQWESTL
tara:strand:+ start:157395 stop:158297 length:903 start_codon:yes stop_codon:yes gene_type:complete